MAAPEQEAKDTSQKIDLSTLPKDSNVHIHVGTEQPEFKGSRIEAEYSKRSLVSIITGAIGAVLGGFGTASYINDKMFDFKTEVLDKTKNNILGRSGIGAGLVEGAAVAYNVVGPDKKKPEEDKNKDWADKVATDKDQPRILS